MPMKLLGEPHIPVEEILERLTLTERWWKQDGVVYCQINDEEPEATAHPEVPFFRLYAGEVRIAS